MSWNNNQCIFPTRRGGRRPGACPPPDKYRGRGPPETSSRAARTQDTVGGAGVSIANGVPRTPAALRAQYKLQKNPRASPGDKRWQGRKPLSVFESVIYLTQPTPRHRTGSPHLPVYLVLQARTTYPVYVAIQRRELLPRVFTLTAVYRP